MEAMIRQKQKRPSVLCQVPQTSSRQQEDGAAVFICKEEKDTGHLRPSSSLPVESAVRQSRHLLPTGRDNPKPASVEARLHDGKSGKAQISQLFTSLERSITFVNLECEECLKSHIHSIGEGTNALFVSGLCRWPGCGAVLEDFSSFLKHLCSEHRHGDRSIGQWRVQQDIVQYMEHQLVLEKQKLIAMQLHLSEHRYSEMKVSSDWPYHLPLLRPSSQLNNEDRVQPWSVTHVDELVQHGHTATGSDHLLQDLVPTIEYYKYSNIRPPYTYAYLIRWSILESPDKQRTLNEIYNWFTTMFFYFRYNTATWKNAVRHNLSLHKCFVRVEGGKGAVWTVDEREYQRRKGQKYHRDCPLKWFTPYSHYCPKDP